VVGGQTDVMPADNTAAFIADDNDVDIESPVSATSPDYDATVCLSTHAQ